jgi:hypothetical protein
VARINTHHDTPQSIDNGQDDLGLGVFDVVGVEVENYVGAGLVGPKADQGARGSSGATKTTELGSSSRTAAAVFRLGAIQEAQRKQGKSGEQSRQVE